MNTLKKTLLSAVALTVIGFTGNEVIAIDTTEQGTADVTFLTPITVTQTTPAKFGEILAPPTGEIYTYSIAGATVTGEGARFVDSNEVGASFDIYVATNQNIDITITDGSGVGEGYPAGVSMTATYYSWVYYDNNLEQLNSIANYISYSDSITLSFISGGMPDENSLMLYFKLTLDGNSYSVSDKDVLD